MFWNLFQWNKTMQQYGHDSTFPNFNFCNLYNVESFCLIVKLSKTLKFVLSFWILHYNVEIIIYFCFNAYMCISKNYTRVCIIWFLFKNKMNFQSFDERNGFGKGNEHYVNNCFLEITLTCFWNGFQVKSW